jgi:hypothetical protein
MTSNNEKLRKIDYGSARRQSLGQMIKSIYNEIPEIEVSARSDLANIQESLWYAAPEVLDTILHKVFTFLQITPILNTPEIPPWLRNIRQIWTTAVSSDKEDGPGPPSASDGS